MRAVEEYDRLGRDAFLRKYGFGPSRSYFLEQNGTLYDSKAIVGAAVGFEHPANGPLGSSEFSGGDATVKSKLEELGFEVVRADGPGDELLLPQTEVDAFSRQLGSPEYEEDERNYKVALHCVLRSLLSSERLEAPSFPELLAAFFERKLDLGAVDLTAEEREFVEAAAAPLHGITNAFINLCGGGYGVNNFVWIPGAIRDGLGEHIRRAFADLASSKSDVAGTVERFRGALVEIQEEARSRPSWRSNWKIVRPSLSFVAALLGGLDPTRFSFYHQGRLKTAYEDLIGEWPRASGGALYEQAVGFIRDVRGALERQGAPVQDLIDAQSFLYLRQAAVSDDASPSTESQTTMHLVVKWSARFEPQTVDLHRAVAEQSGSVWWGLIGKAGSRKLSEASLGRLRSQLEGEKETSVFLVGPGTSPVWRTRLIAVEEERPAAEEELIPSYYPAHHYHSLWVKIASFEEVDRDWLMGNLDPAAHPGKLIALGNQTNPLLVTIRDRPRFWWVNQGTTFLAAREGGHIWAPERDRRGSELAHWTAMRFLRAGDVVLHYANTQLRASGRVLYPAARASQPNRTDPTWAEAGYRADVAYRDLEPSIGLVEIPEDWRVKEGAPFTTAGGVQQGYLFPLSDQFVDLLQTQFPQLRVEPISLETDPPVAKEEAAGVFDLEALRAAAVDRGLRLDDAVLASLLGALQSEKNVILTGPPGTGKTTLAETVAAVAAAAGRCSGHLLTTATADWTTYETIGGLKPDRDGLSFAEGHFLEAIEAGQWLIIDELNRSNFDRAFGQLFTVLSGQTVVLPYERRLGKGRLALVPAGAKAPSEGVEVLAIPKDWRVIATMNVFDKSLLFEMSFALMRRFAFVEVPAPADEVFEALIRQAAGDDIEAATLTSNFLALRKFKDLGPAVFMDLARYLRARREIGAAGPGELAFEGFYSFLLPQFEGIDQATGEELFKAVRSLVGATRATRLRKTLNAVLGLELGEPSASEDGIQLEPGEPDLLEVDSEP